MQRALPLSGKRPFFIPLTKKLFSPSARKQNHSSVCHTSFAKSGTSPTLSACPQHENFFRKCSCGYFSTRFFPAAIPAPEKFPLPKIFPSAFFLRNISETKFSFPVRPVFPSLREAPRVPSRIRRYSSYRQAGPSEAARRRTCYTRVRTAKRGRKSRPARTLLRFAPRAFPRQFFQASPPRLGFRFSRAFSAQGMPYRVCCAILSTNFRRG